MYIEPTPRIARLQELVRPYRATCKEEDRGDYFKEGTPDEQCSMTKKYLIFMSLMELAQMGNC